MNERTNNTSLQAVLPDGPERGHVLTMTSREIADLVEARHNDLVSTIERQIDAGVLRVGRETRRPSPVGEKGGRPIMVYDLDKRDTLVVVSGYDDRLRAKIIDRWMELEQAPKPAAIDFSDPRVLLGAFEHLRATVGEQAEVIAEQGSRLKKLDRIEGALGSMCFTDAAKTLKKAPQELIRFMSSRGWIYKRAGNSAWIGRQEKITVGYIEHREHVYHDKEGYERVATRALITGKGLVRLSEMLEELVH